MVKIIDYLFKNKKRWTKSTALLELVVLVVVLFIINILANFYYHRFDLTAEKRFTLSKTSKELAKKIEDHLYFKLYLDGAMSSKYKLLRDEIRDLAYEFRDASHRNLEIEIVDPLKGKTGKEAGEILQNYLDRGLIPQRDIDNEDGDQLKIKHVIPSAEFIYGGSTIPVNFFTKDFNTDAETNFKRSIENLEYEFANAIRQCVQKEKKRIVFVDGSGEMIGKEVASFANETRKYYNAEALNLNIKDPEVGRPFLEKLKSNPDKIEEILMESLQKRLNNSDAAVIVKPLKDYSPAELYLLDQFLMKGGKLFCLIDPVSIEIDSFRRVMQGGVPALDMGLENINQWLFHYGVTLNSSILADRTCNKIPLPDDNGGFFFDDFVYFPLFTEKNNESHIITKNVGSVWAQFPATMKVRERDGLKTTVLLRSSANTKVSQVPAIIDLRETHRQATEREYVMRMNNGFQISGVLMEGKFKSAFANQRHYGNGKFIEENTNGKIIVLADGDIMRNNVGNDGNAIFPTGFDRYTKIQFGNKKFLLNCLDYLIDNNGLIEIRAKEYQLRLLDNARVKVDKQYYQIMNIAIPALLVLILGIVNYFIRRYKYQR